MLLVRYCCVFVCFFFLVACQTSEVKPSTDFGQTQLRAILTQEKGQWVTSDCNNNVKLRFQLVDAADFVMDADNLMAKAPQKRLFIDAIGTITDQPTDTIAGSFTVNKLNRLTTDVTKGCKEDDYNRVIIRAIGKNPLWVTSIAPKGLVLERVDQSPLILPYVDERLPDGQMNFATEANGQTIQLWVAPERCLDEQTGDVYSMRAILTINYQTLHGCGYLGKSSGLIN